MYLFLTKSYACTFALLPVLKRSAIFGAFVFLFLFFFRPFGLSNLPNTEVLLEASFGFGFITFAAIFFTNWLFPKLLPFLFQEDYWTVLKEITLLSATMTLIALLNSLYLVVMNWTDDRIGELFLLMELNVLGIGIIPIVFFVYYDQNKTLKAHLKGAESLSEKIATHKGGKEKDATKLTIADENGKDEILISGNDLIHISSDRNYLDVFWYDKGEVKKSLVRNRLHLIENKLSKDRFFRCHRSHIVNLSWVTSVKGNARGYELLVKDVEITIPVSRNKIDEMEDHLNHLLR